MYRSIVHANRSILRHLAEAIESESKGKRNDVKATVVNDLIRLNIGECTVNFTEKQALDYLATLKEAENYR